MSIPLDTYCIECCLKRSMEKARKLGSEEKATAFAKDLMRIYINAPEDANSITLNPLTSKLYQRYYGLQPDRYRQEKEESNRFVLARMDEIYRRVNAAQDKVYAGLQFAILGNYIDFSALYGQVSFDQLDEMLDSAENIQLEQDSYQSFLQDLQKGKKLLYITDNAGEICFDRICAEMIAERFPHLQITFCVRGGYALNDATREDAMVAGITFPVIDNGTNIPGTVIKELSPEAKLALDEADVILAKGMGNVETMYGCGYNVYYAFLVKCIKFQKLFGKEKFSPMLLKERK